MSQYEEEVRQLADGGGWFLVLVLGMGIINNLVPHGQGVHAHETAISGLTSNYSVTATDQAATSVQATLRWLSSTEPYSSLP